MSEKLLDQVLRDRSSALRPKAVLLGISTSQQSQIVKEMDALNVVLGGMYREMEMDGTDLRSKIGIMLLRARSFVDMLEDVNSRLIHDREGVLIEGSYERK